MQLVAQEDSIADQHFMVTRKMVFGDQPNQCGASGHDFRLPFKFNKMGG